jgi:hypothetical protein
MPYSHENVLYQVTLPPRDGFDLTVFVVDDPDFDAHTQYDQNMFADLIKAWERDEWQGVGTIVEASRGGVTLGDASIWGSEYGEIDGKHVQPIGDDGTDNIGYLEEKIVEAITAAKAKLAEIS